MTCGAICIHDGTGRDGRFVLMRWTGGPDCGNCMWRGWLGVRGRGGRREAAVVDRLVVGELRKRVAFGTTRRGLSGLGQLA